MRVISIRIIAAVFTMFGTSAAAQTMTLPTGPTTAVLVKARLVDFQFTALGPLMPLRLLIAPPPTAPKP